MSRNSSRVQAVQDPEQPEMVEAKETVRRTANTEFVELPSGGQFYPKNHPLHNKDVVEIRYMTARDEDVLTSPTLLRKGLALDKFIQGIIIDQNIKVDDLLIADKSAIMIGARTTGYGPEYVIKVRCPECNTEGEHSIDLSDYSRWFIAADEDGDNPFKKTKQGFFKATLPVSGQEIVVKLLTARDEKRIQKAAETRSKRKLAESPTTDLLKSIVISIGSATDPAGISDIIMDLPARDSLFIRKNYSRLVPKVEMKELLECQYCGTESEMEVPLEATFFWPDS